MFYSNKYFSRMLWMIIAILSLTVFPAFADSLPKVRIVSVKRIFNNGEHNAFTDLVRYNGRLYLAFRSCPGGHGVNPAASIIILTSKNGDQWEQVFRFHVDQRDTRDRSEEHTSELQSH